MVLAQALLGYPYTLSGRVQIGHQRGRQWGFPTANIHLKRVQVPLLGVFAVSIQGLSDEPLSGVANIGLRPTVGGTRVLLEVHIFDFDETIYGRHVRVTCCKKIRNEEHFPSFDLLKEQIQRDAIAARAYFSQSKNAILSL